MACHGIIPAYAGNTFFTSVFRAKSMGSSPRMRGTLLSRHYSGRCAGIIPAYAGNTSRPQAYSTRSRDHPRVCGEHLRLSGKNSAKPGSSPRMRGTPVRLREPRRMTGIIPAYAGNTFYPMCSLGELRDHPRVCGEHFACRIKVAGSTGSSPRMRGTRDVSRIADFFDGIIPAYAGNT